MRLSGIVYLHRIIDPRMTHGGMRNLAMFRKLCGTDPLHNVILATSFWGEVNQVRGEQREAELRTNPDYWAGMMAKGSRMRRFENTQDSALMIINELASKATVALDIQKEMCDQGLALVDTAAGEALDHELAEMTKKYAKDMEKLQQEIRDAKEHDKELQDALKKQALRVEKTIDEMHAQQEILKADRRNELRAMEQEFDRRLRRMETESQVC
jgi:Skp family chaperone for outer membrane proteins